MTATASPGLGRGEQRAEPAVAEPPDPAQPGRRRPGQPDVQRLGRQRADRGVLHGEEGPVEGHHVGRQHQPQQLERLVEHRAALPGRHREQRPLAGHGRLQAEHRQHPARRQSRERGELLRDQHRMTPGQHRDPAPDLEARGLGERERHPGERVDGRAEDGLRQPQRVDARGLEQGDRCLELVREHRPPPATGRSLFACVPRYVRVLATGTHGPFGRMVLSFP